jgi:hypothetical protein
MRLRLEFRFPNAVTLPWNYLDWLQGLLYDAMRRGLPRVARQVHDVGFRGEGKRYKLVTFSLLYPARHRRLAEGLQMEGPVLWWVSSPVENLLEAVVLGLLKEPEVRLGPQTVFVERVEVEPPPPWADTMTWRTLSPVCVSTGRMPEGLCRPGRPRQGSGLGLGGSRHGGPAGVVERSGLSTLDGPRRSGSGLAGRPAGRGSAGTTAGRLRGGPRRTQRPGLRHGRPGVHASWPLTAPDSDVLQRAPYRPQAMPAPAPLEPISTTGIRDRSPASAPTLTAIAPVVGGLPRDPYMGLHPASRFFIIKAARVTAGRGKSGLIYSVHLHRG